jgi:Fe-S cluster biogenesis protein NfuA
VSETTVDGAQDLLARVEGLLEQLERLPDPDSRDTATHAVQAVVDLYGEGLERIVDALVAREDGAALGEALADDELVAHLLLVHGLHPVPVEQRVTGALESVLPYLESHGGNVELLGVRDGIAHLRLQGSCSGCPSSAMTLKLAIEDAIFKAAPDVEEVQAEGVSSAEPEAPPGGLLQLEMVTPAVAPSLSPATWATAGGMPQLEGGGVLLKEVSGEQVLFLRPNGRVYAYRPACPGCESSLETGTLRATELTCAACGNRYDVLRAGRCLDEPRLHLEPVPLLVDDAGLVKVALGAVA